MTIVSVSTVPVLPLLNRLEPCVEDVVFFPELNHPTVPYAIKQMIAHEVEMEIMRRKEGPIPNPATSLPETASKNLPVEDQVQKQMCFIRWSSVSSSTS